MVDALVGSVRAAYPKLSHRYYGLKAGWFKKKKLAHWDRNAPLPFAATGTIAWPEARNMVLSAYRGFSAARWPISPNGSSPIAGSTRRCDREKRRARFRIRPRPRRIPMC